MRALVPVLLCVPLAASAEAPPPLLPATFDVSAIVPGSVATFEVGGVQPTARVYLFASPQGPGVGPCAPGGTPCLDVRAPFALGSRNADANGEARFTAVVPTLPYPTVWFQAVVLGPAGGVTEVVARVVGDGDLDTDPAATDCDDANPALTSFDRDRDGVSTCGGDCDDADRLRAPGRTEVPLNGRDEDCDGFELCHPDADRDGFGAPVFVPGDLACAGTDVSTLGTDCDDTNASVNPSAGEVPLTRRDENCDGFETCYADGDGDGRGTGGTFVSTAETDCEGPGVAWQAGDCNDLDARAFPGQTAFFATPAAGTGTFDFDCDGRITTSQPTGAYSCSFSFDFADFCTVNDQGWVGPAPACGQSADFWTDCNGGFFTCSPAGPQQRQMLCR